MQKQSYTDLSFGIHYGKTTILQWNRIYVSAGVKSVNCQGSSLGKKVSSDVTYSYAFFVKVKLICIRIF